LSISSSPSGERADRTLRIRRLKKFLTGFLRKSKLLQAIVGQDLDVDSLMKSRNGNEGLNRIEGLSIYRCPELPNSRNWEISRCGVFSPRAVFPFPVSTSCFSALIPRNDPVTGDAIPKIRLVTWVCLVMVVLLTPLGQKFDKLSTIHETRVASIMSLGRWLRKFPRNSRRKDWRRTSS
jgi:hypothetical protein